MPPISGSTSRSSTSRPNRLSTSGPKASGGTDRRGSTGSTAALAIPPTLRIPERTTGQISPGTPSASPPGSRRSAPRDHTYAPAFDGDDERITEPDALRQRDRLGHPREERVCRLVDREPAERGGADAPAESIGRFEHGHLDAGVPELERAREARDPPADDDDVRHVRCTSSTRRASTPGSVSGSTP